MTLTNLLPSLRPAAVQRRVSHETLRSIFAQVRNDPLVGKGYLQADDILIDKILAHINVSAPGALD